MSKSTFPSQDRNDFSFDQKRETSNRDPKRYYEAVSNRFETSFAREFDFDRVNNFDNDGDLRFRNNITNKKFESRDDQKSKYKDFKNSKSDGLRKADKNSTDIDYRRRDKSAKETLRKSYNEGHEIIKTKIFKDKYRGGSYDKSTPTRENEKHLGSKTSERYYKTNRGTARSRSREKRKIDIEMDKEKTYQSSSSDSAPTTLKLSKRKRRADNRNDKIYRHAKLKPADWSRQKCQDHRSYSEHLFKRNHSNDGMNSQSVSENNSNKKQRSFNQSRDTDVDFRKTINNAPERKTIFEEIDSEEHKLKRKQKTVDNDFYATSDLKMTEDDYDRRNRFSKCYLTENKDSIESRNLKLEKSKFSDDRTSETKDVMNESHKKETLTVTSKKEKRLIKELFNLDSKVDVDHNFSVKQSQPKLRKQDQLKSVDNETSEFENGIKRVVQSKSDLEKNSVEVYELNGIRNETCQSNYGSERKIEINQANKSSLLVISSPKTEKLTRESRDSRKYNRNTGKITKELNNLNSDNYSPPVEVILSPSSTKDCEDNFYASFTHQSCSKSIVKQDDGDSNIENYNIEIPEKIKRETNESHPDVWKRLGNKTSKRTLQTDHMREKFINLKEKEKNDALKNVDPFDMNKDKRSEISQSDDLQGSNHLTGDESETFKQFLQLNFQRDSDLRHYNSVDNFHQLGKCKEETLRKDIKSLKEDPTEFDKLKDNDKLSITDNKETDDFIHKCMNCYYFSSSLSKTMEHLREVNHYAASTYEVHSRENKFKRYRVKSQLPIGGIFEETSKNSFHCLKSFCEGDEYANFPILPKVEYSILSCKNCKFIGKTIDSMNEHLKLKSCSNPEIHLIKYDCNGNFLEALKLKKRDSKIIYVCQECNYVSNERDDGIQHVLTTRHPRMKQEIQNFELELPQDISLGYNVAFSDYREALLIILYKKLQKQLKEMKPDESIKVVYKCHFCSFFTGSSQSLLNHLKENLHISGSEIFCEFNDRRVIPIFAERKVIEFCENSKMRVICPECNDFFDCVRDCSNHFLSKHQTYNIQHLFGCYSSCSLLEEKILKFSLKYCEACKKTYEKYSELIQHWKENQSHLPYNMKDVLNTKNVIMEFLCQNCSYRCEDFVTMVSHLWNDHLNSERAIIMKKYSTPTDRFSLIPETADLINIIDSAKRNSCPYPRQNFDNFNEKFLNDIHTFEDIHIEIIPDPTDKRKPLK